MSSKLNYRFAVLISSYKRPGDLIKQIYTMLDQSYDNSNYHIFVAVKGLTEYFIKSSVYPLFSKYIDEGRLTIRYFPNKSQISNLIDCIRGLDIKDYDYFLKVDDDDFYSNDYLKLINEFLLGVNDTKLYNAWYGYGECISLSNNVLCNFNESPSFYAPTLIIDKYTFYKFLSEEAQGHNQQDDWFLYWLMNKEGVKCIKNFLEEKKIYNFFTRNNTTVSATRNGLHYTNGSGIVGNFSMEILHVVHDKWKGSIVLGSSGCYNSLNNDRFTVLEYDPDSYLKVKWDSYDVEEFIKYKDGAWYLKAIVPS